MNMFAGNLQSPPPVNPQQSASWGGLQGAIGAPSQYAGMGSQYMPYAQNTFGNLYNNPYSGQALGGAQDAAGMGGAAAQNQFGIGANLAGAGLNLMPYASSIMNTAFDPQQALYNRTAQQVQDQTRAGEAARGIATSPYGAGLENQALSNFNIDWQNQQLQRQATGAGAAGGLTQQGAGVAGTGAGLMSGAPQGLYQSAMLPYGTWSGIGQGQNQSLMSLLGYGQQGQGIANVPVQDWSQALSGANQMQGLTNQNFQNQLAQSQLGWGQLGGLGSGLAGMFGMAGPFGQFGAFPGLFGSGGGGGTAGGLLAGAR